MQFLRASRPVFQAAQACLSVHLLCLRTALRCLGAPICMPAMYGAPVCHCNMAVHTPTVSLTVPCQLCGSVGTCEHMCHFPALFQGDGCEHTCSRASLIPVMFPDGVTMHFPYINNISIQTCGNPDTLVQRYATSQGHAVMV